MKKEQAKETMEKKKYWIILLMIFYQMTSYLSGQTGNLTGKVTDKETGETLIGATILIEGTHHGTITDYDGNYILSLEPGNYNIVCSYISYEAKMLNVFIEANNEKNLSFDLSPSQVSLEEVEIVAKKVRETEQILMAERKESTIAVESIGARELSQKGAGNVAAGVKKISGISMIGSKQLFVRGLGDRYNSAMLNGLPIASPDPTKKVIKLDIFPSDIVEAISVSKVYNVKNYADYTGALIDISTKDYPVNPFISISAGVGYNSNATFQIFKQLGSNGISYFGLNTKARVESVPGEYKTYRGGNNMIYEEISSTSFVPAEKTAMPNVDFSISGGKLFTIGSKQIGVLGLITFENNYVSEPNALESILRADGTNSKFYLKKSYQYGTNYSNLLNISYKSNAYNKISYNLFYLVNTSDEFNEAEGVNYDRESIGYRVGIFESHRLFNSQLIGNQRLNEHFNLNWAAGIANAKSDNPDTRILALQDFANGIEKEWHFYVRNRQEQKRNFLELNENEYSGKFDFEYKFDAGNKLLFGTQGKFKKRLFDAYFYYYVVDSLEDLIIDPDEGADLINDENFENGKIFIDPGSTALNKFKASQGIYATYANYIHTFNQLTFDIGLRAEFAHTNIIQYSTAIIEKPSKSIGFDVFPALNVKYTIANKTNLRLGASRTITRPSFYELSPSKIPAIGSSMQIVGNPKLVNSYSNNVDVKIETFPNPGELWSLGIYGKYIENPIERITNTSGGDAFYTFENTNKGLAAGLELEGKKKFNQFFAGFNASLIYTYISINSENSSLTNNTRALQGASPYLFNGDVGYEHSYGKNQSSISLVYNVYGKRIWSVGSGGRGDIYELPFNTLDIIIKNRIKNNLQININVKNILNNSFILYQEYYDAVDTEILDGEKEVFRFKKGIESGFSIEYKF